MLGTIATDRRFVARSPHFVRHDTEPFDPDISRQRCQPTGCFQRTIVWLRDDEQDIGIARRATAHMLDRGLHIKYRDVLWPLHQVAHHITHGDMFATEAAFSAMLELYVL